MIDRRAVVEVLVSAPDEEPVERAFGARSVEDAQAAVDGLDHRGERQRGTAGRERRGLLGHEWDVDESTDGAASETLDLTADTKEAVLDRMRENIRYHLEYCP